MSLRCSPGSRPSGSLIISVERGLFPQWRGDLLIATLKAQSLFRARIRDGRVRYFEPSYRKLNPRLIESHDGRLILWTHDGTLISLSPKGGSSGEALFAEKCAGCHQSNVISGNRMGPNLVGVIGRRVASLESYRIILRACAIWGDLDGRASGRISESTRYSMPGTSMDFTGDASGSDASPAQLSARPPIKSRGLQ